MNTSTDSVIYDSLKNKLIKGEFVGSIISKCNDNIIFSDNLTISESEEISISQGLVVGFEEINHKFTAFSKKYNITWENIKESPLEYSVLISDMIMNQYHKEQFSNDFPFTINLSHTAGLYLVDAGINHLEFFKEEILKNPISLIKNGIIMADRVVTNEKGDPVFYDCIIVGRDEEDEIKTSYETFVPIDDENVLYIVILGFEELRE